MQRSLRFVRYGFDRPRPAAFGAAGLAIVLALTGCGGDEDCSVTNSCPNQSPAATISSPADGETTVVGQSVTFSGGAEDPEDGDITGAALVWTSDLDGPIGTGETFTRSDLSGGFHEIVLTATDSEGASGTASITFGVGGAPSVEIDAPVNQPSGAPRTVTVGTSITFAATVEDVEDGPLGGASVVWTSNMDGELGTGTTFSTSALSAGMHTVTLTATDSDANEAKATVLVIVKPAAAPGYQIHIRWSEGVELSAAQRTAVADAVTKLEAVITGDVSDIPNLDTSQPPLNSPTTCGGAAIPTMTESVDDVIIYLEFEPIDGPNNTIGSSGPCITRGAGGGQITAFSLVGGMRFDTADLALIESLGLLDDIVLHEMMHVLGFGIFWEDVVVDGSAVDYLEQPSDPSNPGHMPGMTDTHFTGPEAIAQFQALGGAAYTGGEIVPVENDTIEFSTGSLDGHWRESVFDEEIMTAAANADADPLTIDNPLSVLTIGQFEDLGYTVDYDAADPYMQVFSIVFGPQAQDQAQARSRRQTIDLSGDVWRGPLHAVEPGGETRRVR